MRISRRNVRTATDPFDILFHAAELGRAEARYVEAALRAREVEAVRSADPTPHAADLLHGWKATGRPLAIVSNNSADAVRTYLEIHELRLAVTRVSARTSADVALLKPSPTPGYPGPLTALACPPPAALWSATRSPMSRHRRLPESG